MCVGELQFGVAGDDDLQVVAVSDVRNTFFLCTVTNLQYASSETARHCWAVWRLFFWPGGYSIVHTGSCFMAVPGQTGRRRHCLLNLSIRPSVHLFVIYYQTGEYDILKTKNQFCCQVAQVVKGVKWSTLGSGGQRSRSDKAENRCGCLVKATVSAALDRVRFLVVFLLITLYVYSQTYSCMDIVSYQWGAGLYQLHRPTDFVLVILDLHTLIYCQGMINQYACQSPLTVKHFLIECDNFAAICSRYFSASSVKDVFENVNAQSVIDFIKEI